jgi:hypothetical protein
MADTHRIASGGHQIVKASILRDMIDRAQQLVRQLADRP